MARKVSDMVLLLGSRNRSRSRSKSAFGQMLGRLARLVSGRTKQSERPSQGGWILPVIALACFAGGYFVGGHFATEKSGAGLSTNGPSTKGGAENPRPSPKVIDDGRPLSSQCLIVAAYFGSTVEQAKAPAEQLVTYLKQQGLERARPLEIEYEKKPLLAVVVYCIGDTDLRAARRKLESLPADVPDAMLVEMRREYGKNWPIEHSLQ